MTIKQDVFSEERRTNIQERIIDIVSSVPVRIKIFGIMTLPLIILGIALNYWVRTGLSDWLSYLLSDERVQGAMEAGSRSVILVTALAAILSILLTFLLMLSLTRPLLELRQVAQRVVEGDLDVRSRIPARDEIGQVAEAVNQMINHLVSSQQKLERTNRRLMVLNRIAVAAGRGLGLEELLDISLKTVLEEMSIESGWIFLQDRSSSSFSLACARGLPDEVERHLHDSDSGFCNCQKNILTDEENVQVSVHHCDSLESLVAQYEISTQYVTVPLDLRDRRIGMINMLCAQDYSLSEADIEVLGTIGKQISDFIETTWLQKSLRDKEAERQMLLSALVNAQEGERARLARELHDDAGQQLTGLLVRLKALEKQIPDRETIETVSNLCQTTSETIERVRSLSHRLRPAVLEEFGLDAALKNLADEMLPNSGLECIYKLSLDGENLPFEIETNLYRIAQESLRNIISHAEANRVSIELSRFPDSVNLRIEDDGRGLGVQPVANQRGLGLINIRERTEMLGGSFEIKSDEGKGTSLQVSIPVPLEIIV
ncbi:MAG: HAMP domain-containing protein [Anaerolineales bacterium]|uniref:Oxygen sensor histidine kinase NreB n=1 Tax=Candidatus Desulfolinea nitratireducens TaxID=2841698 RepID=A0A8J6NG33_9CHLR|nr:HAMP domain-containing protein [Candidatus Desulfolinea nitratireducens]